jgi:hypothetical protein
MPNETPPNEKWPAKLSKLFEDQEGSEKSGSYGVEFGQGATILIHPNSRPTVQTKHRDVCDVLPAGGDHSTGRALHFLAIIGR